MAIHLKVYGKDQGCIHSELWLIIIVQLLFFPFWIEFKYFMKYRYELILKPYV